MADETFTPLYPEETEAAVAARWKDWANEGVSPGSDDFVDTEVGSMWWLLTRPGIREAARLYDLLGTEAVAAAFPQFAWGIYLDDHAEREGTTRNEATSAEGDVVFTGPATTVISSGQTVYVPAADSESDPIEFATSAGGTIPAAAAAPSGMSATLVAGGTLTLATVYRYVVTAVDDAGETTVSAEVTGTPASGNRSVLVDWSPIATARSYNVYRKDGGATGPPYNFVANVVVDNFTDTNAIAPNAAVHPPVANTTGGKLKLPVVAVETGASGDVGATAVTGITPTITGTTVTNPLPMLGGADTEDDEPLRARVEGDFGAAGGANVAYYRKKALDYPGVGRVTVIPRWAGVNTVQVVISDAAGQPVSQAIIDGLQAELDPAVGLGGGDAPVGAEVTVTTAAALDVTITATIELDTGYSLDGTAGTIALRALITAAVKAYVESVPSGGEIVLRAIYREMTRIPGVHDASAAITGAAGNGNLAVPSSPPKAPRLLALNLTVGSV